MPGVTRGVELRIISYMLSSRGWASIIMLSDGLINETFFQRVFSEVENLLDRGRRYTYPVHAIYNNF